MSTYTERELRENARYLKKRIRKNKGRPQPGYQLRIVGGQVALSVEYIDRDGMGNIENMAL